LCAKPFFTVALSEIILSLQNSRVKELVKLRESPRRRRELSLFPIEGLREIEVGIDAERMFTEVYFCPSFFRERGEEILLHRFKETDVELVEMGKDAFAKSAFRENPEGLIALAKTFDLQPSRLSLGSHPLVLVLDEVEKPGNLGAVLRSAEAFGVDAVLLSDAVVDFFNPNVIRSSQGLSLRLPVAVGSKEEILAFIRAHKLSICGSSSKNAVPLWEGDFTDGVAILLGSEREGLGSFWMENQDESLVIPMSGSADSLNLSVSAACFLSEAVRQRRGR
tara:strand:+ start:95 stop:931 length:837 start_codon:yes stop_codon:yes gene_type:complete